MPGPLLRTRACWTVFARVVGMYLAIGNLVAPCCRSNDGALTRATDEQQPHEATVGGPNTPSATPSEAAGASSRSGAALGGSASSPRRGANLGQCLADGTCNAGLTCITALDVCGHASDSRRDSRDGCTYVHSFHGFACYFPDPAQMTVSLRASSGVPIKRARVSFVCNGVVQGVGAVTRDDGFFLSSRTAPYPAECVVRIDARGYDSREVPIGPHCREGPTGPNDTCLTVLIDATLHRANPNDSDSDAP
jgi:hypothetical protein